jgi:hypothetical protein
MRKQVILNYVRGRGRAEIMRLTWVATGVQVNFILDFIYEY